MVGLGEVVKPVLFDITPPNYFIFIYFFIEFLHQNQANISSFASPIAQYYIQKKRRTIHKIKDHAKYKDSGQNTKTPEVREKHHISNLLPRVYQKAISPLTCQGAIAKIQAIEHNI